MTTVRLEPLEQVELTSELDKRLRTFPLAAGDVVAIVGGYGGWTCNLMLDNYPGVEVYTWEPQPEMFPTLRANTAGRGVHAFNYGLGIEDGVFQMSQAGSDHCSFVKPYPPERPMPERHSTQGELREPIAAFAEVGLAGREIALLHLNVEGYEFYLVPYLVETGIIASVKHLIVQIHDCWTRDPGFRSLDEWIGMLDDTHIWAWDWGRSWSGWRRKGEPEIDYSAYDSLVRKGSEGN